MRGTIWVESTVQITGTDVFAPLIGIQPPAGQTLEDVDHMQLDREAVEMGLDLYVRPRLKSDGQVGEGFSYVVVQDRGQGRRGRGGVPVIRHDAN